MRESSSLNSTHISTAFSLILDLMGFNGFPCFSAGLNRCGKSCRLRWLNYLRPNIKRGNISDDEEDLILRLHKLLGNRWGDDRTVGAFAIISFGIEAVQCV